MLQLLYHQKLCDTLVRQSCERSRVPILPYKVLDRILGTIRQLLDQIPMHECERHLGDLSARIFKNCSHPLAPQKSMTVAEYVSSFTGNNSRWEAIGNIFAVAGRSLMATPDNHLLFMGDGISTKETILAQVADASNICLSLCDQVFCSNELLISLQVNDVMLKTQQYGDSSTVH